MQFLAYGAHAVPRRSICDEWENQVGYHLWGYHGGDGGQNVIGVGPRSLGKLVNEISILSMQPTVANSHAKTLVTNARVQISKKMLG
jgi:predicted Abi (CAAX) family protease